VTDPLASRYIATPANGRTPLLWRVRARLEDTATGETFELRTEELAEKLGEILALADAGELAPLPADESPFRPFTSSKAEEGWHYLWRSEGALADDSFARTKSEALANRAIEALNRAFPRDLTDQSGPFNAAWF
jgi:hypothetical protein